MGQYVRSLIDAGWQILADHPLRVKGAQDLIIAGLGAFSGAWAAFMFENRREGRKQRNEEYLAVRFAHFAVMSQFQDLVTLRDEYLAKANVGQLPATLALHPALPNFTSTRIDAATLTFLLEGDDPDLLNRVMVGQKMFEKVGALLGIRDQIHLELQRRAATLRAQNVNPATDDQMILLLGKDLVGQLNDITQGLIDKTNDAIGLMTSNLDDITAVSAKRFPKRRAPKIELIPKEERLARSRGEVPLTR
jgi:hypothetical protein